MIWPRSRACAVSVQRNVSSHVVVRVVSELEHSVSQAICWLVPMSALGCDLNRSMQHLDSEYRAEGVEDEAETEKIHH